MEIEKRELYNFIVEEDFNGGYKVIKGPLDKLKRSVRGQNIGCERNIFWLTKISTNKRPKIFES